MFMTFCITLGCDVWVFLEGFNGGFYMGYGIIEKSSDIVTNIEAKLLKVEVATPDIREVVDMLEQGMEKRLGDFKEEIEDLCEVMFCL